MIVCLSGRRGILLNPQKGVVLEEGLEGCRVGHFGLLIEGIVGLSIGIKYLDFGIFTWMISRYCDTFFGLQFPFANPFRISEAQDRIPRRDVSISESSLMTFSLVDMGWSRW